MILIFILDNQLENAKTAKSILLSLVKYKQFDFSLLANGKSIERKVFLLIL